MPRDNVIVRRRRYRGSRWRAVRRATALALLTLAMAPLQSALHALGLPLARRLPMRWHRLCLLMTGLRLRRFGEPETQGPVLYVANHASYLDIPVLGSLLEASFVAKAEVARWPVVGYLCRLQRTVFVDRQVVSVLSHLSALQGRLAAGDNMVLFPEGTSSDGNRVLPFKGALFRAAMTECEGRPVRVQPVTIAYSGFNGMPMGRNLRPFFAWYGDMAFPGHFGTCLGMGRAVADVVFHPSVTLAEFASPNELAQHCQAEIARALSDSLAGRLADRRNLDCPVGREVEVNSAPAYSL